MLAEDTIEFVTLKNGSLYARPGEDDGIIELDFPATPAVEVSLTDEETANVCCGFGIEPADIRLDRHRGSQYSTAHLFLFFYPLDSAAVALTIL